MLSLESMDYKGDFIYVAKDELDTKQVIEIPVILGYHQDSPENGSPQSAFLRAKRGVGKLQLLGQIQPATCVYMAHELKIALNF